MLRRLTVMVLSLIALAGCAGAVSSGADGTATGITGGTAAVADSASASMPSGTALALVSPSPMAPTAGDPAATTAAEDPTDATAADGEDPDVAPQQPVLLLEAGGLGVAVDETRIDQLPFGTSASVVRTAVTHVLGRLTTQRATCGQGIRTSSTVDGFELLFRGTRFVGWTDRGASGRHLTTGDGIGVGITVAALRGSGTDITLGRLGVGSRGEWTSGPGGLYGRTTSTSSRGRVTLVSSGENCLVD